MIGSMFFGMGHALGRVPPPWGLVVNALLLVQFPLVHSAMLTPIGAKALKKLAPGSVAGAMMTTTYVIVASIQVFVLFAFWTPSGIIWWQASGVLGWLLTGLYTCAWLLLLKAIWDAGIGLQTGALGWWAVVRGRKPVFPPMPTRGLFKLIRQPIYAAFFLTLWTVPIWTPDQLAVALVLSTYCIAGPLLKETRFRQRFGTAFADYATRIPYMLPRLSSPRQRNDLSIYDASSDWWSGKVRWQRVLHNLVPARLAAFDHEIDGWQGKSVLDLGCGGGFMAEAMARRGAQVTGIDPSPKAIAAARAHAEASGLTIAYDLGSGENLPHADQSFDIVVCVDVFEHIDALDPVIAEIARVLRPGGLLLFDTINRTWLASFIMITLTEDVLGMIPRGTHDPAMFIKPDALRAKLEVAGFTVGRFRGLGPRGVDRHFDVTFGGLPTFAVQYLGSARTQTDIR
jgi:2-polyprenyl-6-hydroxyphenyl methylase/3-demethylubiquinone-9 3-methyltransferase